MFTKQLANLVGDEYAVKSIRLHLTKYGPIGAWKHLLRPPISPVDKLFSCKPSSLSNSFIK